ncbi:hypothetical protein PBY51_024071 [Eleginops maclovinus]|uniref:Cadherin domain-containing protein n=1 Tax=Eleginops maclovinus TaxID=56733 RepID=A0AAN7XYX0_ELEMC|nr:hypothetical protein PBY51_024071 [Eleginops maclovinus]
MLDKAVDYEDVKNLDLGLIVKNKVPLYDGSDGISATNIGLGSPGASGASGASGPVGATGGSGGTFTRNGTTYKTYPIKINVKNKPEGPRFDPKVKTIPVSEGGSSVNTNEVIARYAAIDGDTGKAAENVRYAKGSDPDNWFTIDPKTADIKLNKMPDRESPYLINGTYYAKVLCFTEDMPAQTATGTVAIQVEDFNDNCPTLTSQIQTLCIPNDAVIVSAKDEDFSPNGSPFNFEIIPEGTQGKWKVEHYNDTAAILRAKETLWPGLYEVTFVVEDQQGKACPEPQKVTVLVCTCEEGDTCGDRGNTKKGAELGPAGIGLLLLGLLLLLLFLLFLLFCNCGESAGFTPMPFDTKSHLINYHTEGQGENTDVPLLNIPLQVGGGGVIDQHLFQGSGYGLYKDTYFQDAYNAWGTSNVSDSRTWIRNEGSQVQQGIYDGMALPDHFLGQYYSQKVTSEDETLGGKDTLLVYEYEGQGSLAGSVGCCSLLESENDLQFINDLGMKFKTLAEVCGGKKIESDVKPAFTHQPSASIHTHISASSVKTAQQPAPLPNLHQSTSQTVIRDTSESSQVVKKSTATVMEGMTTVSTGMTQVSTGMTTVNEGMVNTGQMFMLQPQPVYYTTTTTPVQMQYVLQPQVQNTVLLAEAPASNLQSMVLLNGSQTGSMGIQGQMVISSGQAQDQHMVLVEKSRVHGRGGNLIHTGNLSGSKTMMVVEGKVPKGTIKGLKGSQTHLMQGGTLQSGGLSGSQRVVVVGGQSNRGQLVQEAQGLSQKQDISGSQRVIYSEGSTSAGSQSSVVTSSTTTENKTPTYRKVVVQETREIH